MQKKISEQEDEFSVIEKATGKDGTEPTYQEILDTFREGLEKDELEDEKSVQKEIEPDVVKTAEADSKLYPSKSLVPKKGRWVKYG